MPDLTVISVPFHLGRRGVGMGRGPLDLLGERALADRLRAPGRDVEVVEVSDPAGDQEVGRSFEIARELAGKVSAARRGGRLALILAGNCNVCLGALGGIDSPRAGIIWLDAHPDFHTSDTTDSGFFDGMGLAIATGADWRTLARSIPGFHFVEEQNAILIGARDIDAGERKRLDDGDLTVIEGGGGPGSLAFDRLEEAVTTVASRVDGVYLHFDLDSLDPTLGRANQYACPGGLGLDDARAVISIVSSHTPVFAASFTAYNPDVDPDRFGETATDAIKVAVEAITSN
jgi:arginase